MTEDRSHLTDEDLDRMHGEHLLHIWEEGRKRREEENRSLLEALVEAQRAQVEGGRGGDHDLGGDAA